VGAAPLLIWSDFITKREKRESLIYLIIHCSVLACKVTFLTSFRAFHSETIPLWRHRIYLHSAGQYP